MTARARVLLLGPVQVFADDAAVPLHGVRQERVVAVLALSAGWPVSVDRLVDAVWNTQAPPTARRQVQDLISRLRRDLASGGVSSAITMRGDAYILELPAGAVDAGRFRTLADRAHAMRRSDPGQAREHLREALALWRGEPLAGHFCPILDSARLSLSEQRLAAVEQLLEIELELGTLPQLNDVVELLQEHPLREGLVGSYMHALYRMGRTADAIEAFQRLRRLLDEELGVGPGPRVRGLYDAIVRSDPGLMPETDRSDGGAEDHGPVDDPPIPAASASMSTLPRDVRGFVGRQSELRWLSGLVTPHGPAPVVVLCGPGGVGKTTLAIHWAHQAARQFPDGRLFVDLRGFSGTTPRSTADAAARLLIALGMQASSIPSEEDAVLHLYRQRLAGGRVLVVLDNAATVEQVRPLIPAGTGCGVIVTSRRRLDGLVVYEGARSHSLATLDIAESLAILRDVLGPDQMAAESHAAQELVELCGGMPLALKIAAANLAAHPGHRLDSFCTKLRHNRLDTLRLDEGNGDGEATLRATLVQTHQLLTEVERRTLRLLALHHGDDIGVEAVSALLGLNRANATTVLERLADVHLLEAARDDHYALHDLVREFAKERLMDERAEADAASARNRLLSFYVASTDNAMAVFLPSLGGTLPRDTLPPNVTPAEFDDARAAIEWLDTEAANLTAEACAASRHGPHRAAVHLADALLGFFLTHRDANRLMAVAEAAVVAADAEGNQVMQARALRCLGIAHLHGTGDYPAAERALRDAVRLARALGDLRGAAHTLIQLCGVTRETGRLSEALAYAVEALHAAELAGAPMLQAGALFQLGALELDFGDSQAACEYAQRAGDLYLVADASHGVAHSLLIESEALLEMGDLAGARARAEEALERSQQAGLDMIRLLALLEIVVLTDRDGNHRDALALAHEVIELAEASGNPALLAHCRIYRGDVLLHLDDLSAARDEYLAALKVVQGTRQPHATILAHLGLAKVATAGNDLEEAQRRCALAAEEAEVTEITTLKLKAAALREQLPTAGLRHD